MNCPACGEDPQVVGNAGDYVEKTPNRPEERTQGHHVELQSPVPQETTEGLEGQGYYRSYRRHRPHEERVGPYLYDKGRDNRVHHGHPEEKEEGGSVEEPYVAFSHFISPCKVLTCPPSCRRRSCVWCSSRSLRCRCGQSL